jgi:hypothetical protein
VLFLLFFVFALLCILFWFFEGFGGIPRVVRSSTPSSSGLLCASCAAPARSPLPMRDAMIMGSVSRLFALRAKHTRS